ncbi:hypothetical protein [Nocardiopsis metallicus]|uniref:hypothetical protein n=1 Tax=Nocardiopsis metallicus TaxID=179819 RepID=UPI00161AF42E
MAAPAYSTRPRNRWYRGRNRHYYNDGPDFSPRRSGGLASLVGCLVAVVGLLVILVIVALL